MANHLKSVYYGVCAKDELPNTAVRPLAIVVNSDPSTKDGTHWSAIYLHQNGSGEYFDSYGQPPNPVVRKYLQVQAPGRIPFNTRMLQNWWSTVCGAYCVQYLEARNRERDIPFSTLIQKLFPYKESNRNDELVRKRMKRHYGLEIPLIEHSFLQSRIRNNRVRPRERIGRRATHD